MRIKHLEVFYLRKCRFHTAGIHIWFKKKLVWKCGTKTIPHVGPWSMDTKD